MSSGRRSCVRVGAPPDVTPHPDTEEEAQAQGGNSVGWKGRVRGAGGKFCVSTPAPGGEDTVPSLVTHPDFNWAPTTCWAHVRGWGSAQSCPSSPG